MNKIKQRIKETLGTSDFKELMENNGYFVDKSLFIKHVWEDSKILLIPRPRRFGKTLNLSMLRYFFEISKEDTGGLFKNLKIWKFKEYQKLQGKFPVVFVTFKDIKASNFETAYEKIKNLISELYDSHKYLLPGLSERQKTIFEDILNLKANKALYENSLKYLTDYLEKYFNEKPIVLIDEYDVPLHEAYIKGYFDDMIDFIKGLLSAVFKDNPKIKKGVISGCLRISKESIFTGLNNLTVSTILMPEYNEDFGFLEEEVYEILKSINALDKMDTIRKWYNGYIFGGKVLYNPWSIMNFAKSEDYVPRPYWANTSSNELIKMLILNYGIGLKDDMEKLLRDESIVKPINENIIFKSLKRSDMYIWSLLLFSGYLKPIKCWVHEITSDFRCELKIPNNEVRFIFRQFFLEWLNEGLGSNNDVLNLINAILNGNDEVFEELLNKLMINSLSYHDFKRPEPEKVYHAFVLGLLVNIGDKFLVKSNPESGYGRVDVLIIPKNKGDAGVLMEFKIWNKNREKDIKVAFNKAKKQLEEKKYEEVLKSHNASPIIKYIAVFDGKRVWVEKV